MWTNKDEVKFLKSLKTCYACGVVFRFGGYPILMSVDGIVKEAEFCGKCKPKFQRIERVWSVEHGYSDRYLTVEQVDFNGEPIAKNDNKKKL